MISFDIKNSKIDKGLRPFFYYRQREGENVIGWNLKVLEANPSKLLKFYLHCKERFFNPITNDLAGRVRQSYLNEIYNTLLTKRLSSFDFIKFMARDPTSLPRREKTFVEALEKFIQDLAANPTNERLQKKALKICKWIEGDEKLKKMGAHLLFAALQTSYGKPFSINRLKWAAHLPGFSPMFLGSHYERKTEIKEGSLQILRNFIEEGSSLPDSIEFEDLYELYLMALGYDGKLLKRACLDHPVFQKAIADDVLSFLTKGLEMDDPDLISAAVVSLNLINLITLDISVGWDAFKGLDADIMKLTPFSKKALKACASNLKQIHFSCEEVPDDFPELKLVFPKINYLNLVNITYDLGLLIKAFPNLKRIAGDWIIFSEMQNQSTENKIEILEIYVGSDWEGISLAPNVFIPDSVFLTRIRELFPHLHLCTFSINDQQSSYSIRKDNDLFICINSFDDHSFLFWNSWRQQVTDSIFIHILEHLDEEQEKMDLSHYETLTDASIEALSLSGKNSLKFLIVEECTKLTDKSLVYLANCPKLASLDLSGCNISQSAIDRFRARLPECVVIKRNQAKRKAEDFNLFDLNLPDTKKSRND